MSISHTMILLTYVNLGYNDPFDVCQFQVLSMRGTFIASQMNADKSMKSVISFNMGAEWHAIPKPDDVSCEDSAEVGWCMVLFGMLCVNRYSVLAVVGLCLMLCFFGNRLTVWLVLLSQQMLNRQCFQQLLCLDASLTEYPPYTGHRSSIFFLG